MEQGFFSWHFNSVSHWRNMATKTLMSNGDRHCKIFYILFSFLILTWYYYFTQSEDKLCTLGSSYSLDRIFDFSYTESEICFPYMKYFVQGHTVGWYYFIQSIDYWTLEIFYQFSTHICSHFANEKSLKQGWQFFANGTVAKNHYHYW